jgi:phosphoglycolate phosphatase-like HAD superfamily hydrolase
MTLSALVFDLDGVIVKTNYTKHAAMLSLFAKYPERQRAISDFILSNGGVPRREKLTRILRDYLDLEPTDLELNRHLMKYANVLQQALLTAPAVEGVIDFICNYRGARYVCSSAPEAEVCEQLSRLSLYPLFDSIYGGTTPKHEALLQISAMHANQPVVFFGDSLGDYQAACRAEVNFIGVACERDNFAEMPIVKVKDFSAPSLVELAIHHAASQCTAPLGAQLTR